MYDKITGLTLRQERFCREYPIDGVGSRAAIRAGYAPKNAKVTAYQLLKNPLIQKRMEDIQAEEALKADPTIEDVLQALKAVAFDPTAKNIDRLRAAESLAKHLGMFKDRPEVAAKSSAPAMKFIQFDGPVIQAGQSHSNPRDM